MPNICGFGKNLKCIKRPSKCCKYCYDTSLIFRKCSLKNLINYLLFIFLQLFSPQGIKSDTIANIPEISRCHLKAPKDNDNKDITIQLGRGAFGRCQKMYYKGIPVAVKEYKNLFTKDIQHEAAVMARCSHPSLPHIFGVNLTQKPFFLVSCFYGIKNQACTLRHALYSPAIHFTKHCAPKIMFEL